MVSKLIQLMIILAGLLAALHLTGVPPAFTAYLPLILSSGSATSPLPLSGVTYWAYQIQELSTPGAVPTVVNSHYDVLVLEPTRTDWSSDDKFFNTKDIVAQLKNSQVSDGLHHKRVIAYIDIGEAEDWRWYWTWSTGWDCQTPKPADWPAYILTCDPDGWGGNYPVAYWHSTWKDIIIYGQNTGSHPDRDYASVIDEVIKDGFDGIYLDWVEGYENSDVRLCTLCYPALLIKVDHHPAAGVLRGRARIGD